MEERVKNIAEACLREKSRDPVAIFRRIAQSDAVRIHGPEHHVLDGAALLTAFITPAVTSTCPQHCRRW